MRGTVHQCTSSQHAAQQKAVYFPQLLTTVARPVKETSYALPDTRGLSCYVWFFHLQYPVPAQLHRSRYLPRKRL